MPKNFFFTKRGVYILTYLLVAFITVIDHQTGYEVSTSILYLLPIYYIASSRLTSKRAVLIIAAVCSLSWFSIELITRHPYSSAWILYWNALVRAGIFFSIAIFVNALSREQQKLKLANLELQRLNAEKNKYIGITAHDLRSPVGNIYNLSDLMLDPKSSANLTVSQQEFLTLINKTSYNALNLLDNLLDVAQIEAGTLKIKKEKHDYLEFIREIIAINQHIATNKEQKIVLESDNSEVSLEFDRSINGFYTSFSLLNH